MPKSIHQTRILVFGTFDVLHSGHLNFFRQARHLARRPFLIVSVAKSVNVRRIKGRRPRHSERSRLAAVRRVKIVNQAVLAAAEDYLGHIVKLNPEIIGLGYDQTAYTKGLVKRLRQKGLKVKIARLRPYQPQKYKSSLL
ncbi:MAG: adenylyltransferase/cytidyltransferase family protein [Patescibacteria group bacterium]|nr:adenylyltransferase/cytidyltransferase family protein [Patescibacteria group bacterium]